MLLLTGLRVTPTLAPSLVVRCTYCFAPLADPVRSCKRCGTGQHEACFRELGRCTTLGCPNPLAIVIPRPPAGRDVAPTIGQVLALFFGLVTVVLALLFAGARVSADGGARVQVSRRKRAMIELLVLNEAIERYRANGRNEGRWPSSLDELVGRGLMDPWGRRYVYTAPTAGGRYGLLSLGADGVPGGTGEDADLHLRDALADQER